MIVSIITFFIIFSVIVIGHEFGHFAIARRNGIRVTEFDIGMGPLLWHKKRGDTDFCIRLLPVGGACIFDGADALADGVSEEEMDEHAYPRAGVFARMATVLGGPFMNFLLGFVFALIIVAFSGTDLPVVYQVQKDSAAQEAGIEAGDTITNKRGDQTKEITLTPKYSKEDNRYYIGLVGSGSYVRTGPLQTFRYAYYEALYWVRATFKSLGLIVRGHFHADDLSGPVGIVKVVDDTYTESKPYGLPAVLLSFLSLSTLLSINLGIMNLLPFPALDGGRLVLLIIEAIRGKKLNPRYEGYITMAGAMMLIALMIFVLFNDITKFF